MGSSPSARTKSFNGLAILARAEARRPAGAGGGMFAFANIHPVLVRQGILAATWCLTFGAMIPILHNPTVLVDRESCRADDLARLFSGKFNDAAACL